ncbi:MAG: 2-amino-4-hydroxy-6-hydroxymethyldihydropteridine diphosphokinase [Halioglobus sp.]
MSKSVPAYIALGSNLEDPSQQLHSALDTLAGNAETQLVRVSSFYRSKAVGPGEQPDYLNAAALIHTRLEPEALLTLLQSIESEQGRKREERWGPRTLDLDILLYGSQSINTPTLCVPHSRMHERDFVLYPLREISDTEALLAAGFDLGAFIDQLPTSTIIKTTETHIASHDGHTGSPEDNASNVHQ